MKQEHPVRQAFNTSNQPRTMVPLAPLEHEHILHFTLSGVLPTDHRLALDCASGILVQFGGEYDPPRMLMTRQFTSSELSLLVPLLESYPDYCPHEVLLACFNSGSTHAEEEAIHKSRRHLHAAQMEGAFDQEMRPVRNVLSRTRLKLHSFAIDVTSLLETGYLIRPLSKRSHKLREVTHQ